MFPLRMLYLMLVACLVANVACLRLPHNDFKRNTIQVRGAAKGIGSPISAAWLYMTDDLDYWNIPSQWATINFKMVDVLYVGPAGIQTDGTFGLYHSNTTGPLANRFRWVVQNARAQNPNIKIIISQWYGSTPNVWGYDLSVLNSTQRIEKYASSIQAFLKYWLPCHGGVDGFDIDFESQNIVRTVPTIFAQVRKQFNALSKIAGGRRFYITVSPVVVTYLQNSVPYLDYVNMQTYGGSMYTINPQRFLDIGLEPQQLLYGICPETSCATRNVSQVEDIYGQYNLTGIHLWRLNSDNSAHELKIQKQIYNFLHRRP